MHRVSAFYLPAPGFPLIEYRFANGVKQTLPREVAGRTQRIKVEGYVTPPAV